MLKLEKRIQTAPPGEIAAARSIIRGNQNQVHLNRKTENKTQAVISVMALVQGVGMAPLVGTVLYAFLSIQVDGSSILDFLRRAACFLLLQQQKYEWRLDP